MRAYRFNLQSHEDETGALIVVEGCKDIPFHISRVYYLYGIGSGAVRGCHAHKSLEQVLICVHGKCRVMLDDGREKITLSLYRLDEGLFISHTIWREVFDFSSDAVLMVLASDQYDESDYIRDYDEFLKYVKDHESITGEEIDDGDSFQ